MHAVLESYLNRVISSDAWNFQSVTLNDKKQVLYIWSIVAVYGLSVTKRRGKSNSEKCVNFTNAVKNKNL